MLLTGKMSFSEEAANTMRNDLDGYVWMVLDIKKGIVVAGDELVTEMKKTLFEQKCSIYDIYGVGLDLRTGEIDYSSEVNKKLIDKESTKEVPAEKKRRVEALVKYFFSELPVFKLENRGSRYSKRV